MIQIISHWFYTLDLNNQTFQRKFLEILAFTSSPHQVLRVEMLIVYVCVCLCLCVYLTWTWTWTRTRKKPSGETDDFLTWAILYDSIEAQANTWTNSVLYIEPSDVYLPMISHSVVELAAAVYVILIPDHHGKPSGCRNYTPHFKMEANLIPWTSLNCKQCSYISYEYTCYGPHSGVT